VARFTAGNVALALSRNSNRILIGSADGQLIIWDIATAAEVVAFPQHDSAIINCEFSTDEEAAVAVCKNGTVKKWNCRSSQLISEHRLDTGTPQLCLINPGASRILWVTSERAGLYNAEGAELIADLNGHGEIICGAFSSDGTQLVTATNEERLVIWAATNGALLSNFIHHMSYMIYATVVEPQHFSWCIFSPDSETILTGSARGSLKLWNTKTGEQLLSFENNSNEAITSGAFSDNGRSFLTGCSSGTLRLWDAEAGNQPRTDSEVFSDEVTCLSVSSDGTKFLAATQLYANYSTTGTLTVFDTQTGRAIGGDFLQSGPTSCCVTSDDEVMIVYSTGELYTWSLSGNNHPRNLEINIAPHAVSNWSADSSQLITGTGDGQLILWDRSGRRIAESKKRSQSVSACAIAPDGEMAMAGYQDGLLELRSLRLNDQPLATLMLPGEIRSCAFPAHGPRIAAVTAGGMLYIWDRNDATPKRVVDGLVSCKAVTFSSDGERAASGYGDGWFRIRNIETGEHIAECGLGTGVTTIAWSKNAESIAVGTSRGEVQVFHLRNTASKLRIMREELQ
jgi:WD40 repeat protein